MQHGHTNAKKNIKFLYVFKSPPCIIYKTYGRYQNFMFLFP